MVGPDSALFRLIGRVVSEAFPALLEHPDSGVQTQSYEETERAENAPQRSFHVLLSGLPALLAYRLSLEFDSVSTMDNAIEDAISDTWIANLFVPVRDRHLRSKDQGAALIPVIADFEEVAAFVVF